MITPYYDVDGITIYHGDCREILPYLPKVDLVLTDPPYGVAYKTGRRRQDWHKFCTEIANDRDMSWVEPCCEELERLMQDNTALYWFSNHDAIDIVKPVIEGRFAYKNTITWVKNNHTAGDLEAQYGKRTELIVYANKGRRQLNGGRIDDVWNFDKVVGDMQWHQNEKPVELIERAIVKSSSESDIILDPFMGSGTTAVACIRTNRHFIGFEIDPQYHAIAEKRIELERSQLRLDL